MPLIFINKIDEVKAEVLSIHYHDNYTDEQKEKGIFLFDIPQPKDIPGKIALMFYNQDLNKVYYEYIDRPLTPEEKIQQLETTLIEQEQRNIQNEQAIMELTTLVGGMTNV